MPKKKGDKRFQIQNNLAPLLIGNGNKRKRILEAYTQ